MYARNVFEEVLGIGQIGIDDHFFELGGDSIKAIRVISKLREAGYGLSVKTGCWNEQLG